MTACLNSMNKAKFSFRQAGALAEQVLRMLSPLTPDRVSKISARTFANSDFRSSPGKSRRRYSDALELYQSWFRHYSSGESVSA